MKGCDPWDMGNKRSQADNRSQFIAFKEFPGHSIGRGSRENPGKACRTPQVKKMEFSVWGEQKGGNLQDIIPERRALHRKKKKQHGGQQRVPSSINKVVISTCTWGNYMKPGGKNTRRHQSTAHSTHTGPGTVATVISQTGKPLNSQSIW